MRKSPQGGFTFIELMAALVCMALIAVMAMPLAELTAKRRREAELRTALREIRTALDAYHRAADEGRIPRLPGESGYPPNLTVLVDGVADAEQPERPRLRLLRRLPRDPMHADVALPAEQTWGLRSYDSPPEAPRSGADVFDIYSLSQDTAIDGSRYRDW